MFGTEKVYGKIKEMEKRNVSLDLTKLVFGKVPPSSKELEDQVLGGMMLDANCVTIVLSLLKESDFYTEKNKIIFRAIKEVSQNNVPDISLVAEWVSKGNFIDEVGGVFGIMTVTNTVVSTANIEAYCHIIKQKGVQRRLIEFAGTIVSRSYENSEDVFDILSEAEDTLKGINYELSEMKVTQISNIAMNVIEEFESKVYMAKNNIVDERTIYTHIRGWDEINGSLFPGLYVVAGRPGMGKGVHMTELICRMGKHMEIGVINGEMTDEQLLKRIGCNLMGIDNFLFKKNPKLVTDEEQEKLREAMNEALQLKLHIDGNRYINKIANKIKRWVEKDKVKCVFADFLTLFKVPKELERAYNTQLSRVDYILDYFVSLCKDLKIPIILYVQMNREILGRHGVKEPNLADLKASGSIEELAFQVSFLHRPEYYDEKAVTDEMGESVKGLMYQIIAKHRDGAVGRLKFRANLACSKLSDWEEANRFMRNVDVESLPF